MSSKNLLLIIFLVFIIFIIYKMYNNNENFTCTRNNNLIAANNNSIAANNNSIVTNNNSTFVTNNKIITNDDLVFINTSIANFAIYYFFYSIFSINGNNIYDINNYVNNTNYNVIYLVNSIHNTNFFNYIIIAINTLEKLYPYYINVNTLNNAIKNLDPSKYFIDRHIKELLIRGLQYSLENTNIIAYPLSKRPLPSPTILQSLLSQELKKYLPAITTRIFREMNYNFIYN